MKKLTLLCLLLIAGQTLFAAGHNSVFSPNGTLVFAVGNTGNYFYSTNGGQSFTTAPQGSTNFNCVHGSGTRIVIVGDGGLCYVSANSGNSFTSYFAGSNHLRGVYFFDAMTGWAVGNNGVIYKTITGGVSWTNQNSGTAVNLNSVKFTDANNGVVCGNNGTVLYTANGGTTWTPYSTGTTMDLLSVDKSGTTIIATGRDGYIYKYNGATWSGINYKSIVKPEIRSVRMIDANNFFTGGGGGFITKTTDGGTTKAYQQNPLIGNLTSIYFYSATNGWACNSTNDVIINTVDGGATWNLPTGGSVTYSWTTVQSSSGNIGNGLCQHPTNKNAAFAMMGNNVYRSYDKGVTWQQFATCTIGSSCHSFFVSPLDTNKMICSKGSGGGYVAVSTNYGSTWTAVWGPGTLTSYGMPLEIDANDPNVYYLAPDGVAMLKTTNFGTTWTTLGGGEPGNIFRSPCDVVSQYENSSVLFVGDGTTGSGSGKFWKSVNGGLNWTLINTVSGSEIPMIAQTSLDLNLLYHTTWGSGGFWKSINQGSAFTMLGSPGGNLWAADIAKDDPTAVAYGTYGSTGYISYNSGTSFSTFTFPSSPGAGVLFMDKAACLFIQGSGMTRMTVTYSGVTANTQISSEVPTEFSLNQNYPNPFNPTTQIKYNVKENSFVSIIVYNILGKEVSTIINQQLAAGKYQTDFNAANLSSGVYFYTLAIDGQKIDTKKMMLVK